MFFFIYRFSYLYFYFYSFSLLKKKEKGQENGSWHNAWEEGLFFLVGKMRARGGNLEGKKMEKLRGKVFTEGCMGKRRGPFSRWDGGGFQERI